MYTVEELELSLLAYFWNVQFCVDRQASAFSADTNQLTGLPNSAGALLPTARAASGARLALEMTPVPSDLAASMMKYPIHVGGAQGEHEWRELSLKPKNDWTVEETETHGVLTHRLKLAAHKLGAQGFLNLQPPDDMGEPQPYGDDGMTARIQLTPSGLAEAKKRVAGTKFEHWKRGWDDSIAPSEKRQAPEWLQAQWRLGSGPEVR
jgi:hypothetical protein